MLLSWPDRLNQWEEKRFHRFVALLVLGLGLIFYVNTVGNEYGIDDSYVTVTNPQNPENPDHALVSKGISGIPAIFSSHMVQGREQSFGYRPLVLTTYAIEYSLFGANPHVSHLVNVLLYVLLCWLLFKVVMKVFPDQGRLFWVLVPLLFLIHPMHTEVVNNLKSRDELLCLLFGLIGLWYLLRMLESKRWFYAVFVLLALTLAFFSKKTALAFVGIYPVVLLFRDRKYLGFAAISIAVAVGAYILYRFLGKGMLEGEAVRITRWYENVLFEGGTWSDRFAAAAWSYGWYLKQMLLPFEFSSYYGHNAARLPGWSHVLVWFGIVANGALAVWAILKRKVAPTIALGVIWYLGVMLGFSNLYKPVVGVVADRFTFIASVGFCIALAAVLLQLKTRFDKRQKSGSSLLWKALVFGLVLLSLARVVTRNLDWYDRITLYSADVLTVPESAKMHALLAGALTGPNSPYQANVQEATQISAASNGVAKDARMQLLASENAQIIQEVVFHWQEAIRIYPDYKSAHNNLGQVLLDLQQNPTAARAHFLKVIALDSTYAESWYNLAVCEMRQDAYQNAIDAFKQVLRLDPNNQQAKAGLKSCLLEANRFDDYVSQVWPQGEVQVVQTLDQLMTAGKMKEASGVAQAAILQHPDFYKGWETMVKVSNHLGDVERAAEVGEAMLQKFPDGKEAYLLMAQFYLRQENFAAALRVNEQGATNMPSQPLFSVNAGDLQLRSFQNLPGAIAHYERALALAPNDSQLRAHIVQMCRSVGDEQAARRFEAVGSQQ